MLVNELNEQALFMIHYFKSLSSTQEEMKALLATQRGEHLDVVWAEDQTGGRGRHGNEWTSLAGNLAASVLIKTFRLPVTWIPIWVGTALVRALKNAHEGKIAEGPWELRLKWPNDLFFRSGAKVGGILCEKVETGVIVGVGLNLRESPAIPGREVGSIRQALAGREPVSAEGMIPFLLKELESEPSESQLLAEFWKSALFVPGDEISWSDARSAEVLTGIVIGLGVHGELKVRLQDGQTRALFSEEIQGVKGQVR